MWHNVCFSSSISRSFFFLYVRRLRGKEKRKEKRNGPLHFAYAGHVHWATLNDGNAKKHRVRKRGGRRRRRKKSNQNKTSHFILTLFVNSRDSHEPIQNEVSLTLFFFSFFENKTAVFLLYSSPRGSECNLIARYIQQRTDHIYIYMWVCVLCVCILIGLPHGIWMNANPARFPRSAKSWRV